MTIPELIERLEGLTNGTEAESRALGLEVNAVLGLDSLIMGNAVTSVDAALQLFEHKLPGWSYYLLSLPGWLKPTLQCKFSAIVMPPDISGREYERILADGDSTELGPTAPIALCIAILRALQPKEGE